MWYQKLSYPLYPSDSPKQQAPSSTTSISLMQVGGQAHLHFGPCSHEGSLEAECWLSHYCLPHYVWLKTDWVRFLASFMDLLNSRVEGEDRETAPIALCCLLQSLLSAGDRHSASWSLSDMKDRIGCNIGVLSSLDLQHLVQCCWCHVCWGYYP